MTRVFLYGDVDRTFAAATMPFVQAARSDGSDGTIALLLQGGPGWEAYVDRYRAPWMAAGAAGVMTVVPDASGEVDAVGMDTIARCSAIFVAGGSTPAYHRSFVASAAGDLIRSRVAAGLPYGGVSAGALLAGDLTILGGTRVTEGRGVRSVSANEAEPPSDLAVRPGLGLIPGVVVDVHFTELGRFPRLASVLDQGTRLLGIGIDEPAGVRVEHEYATVLGEGRVYEVRRGGSNRYLVTIHQPGDRFGLETSAGV